jgi:type IX secretion system PorP/SprF family membrane protein
VSVGLGLFHQLTGSGYTYQTGYASFSYTGVQFGRENTKRLALALQAGSINKRFDPSKFQTGSQWNNMTGYDPSAGSNELMPANASLVFDAGAGIMYYDVDADKKLNPYIGVSVSHLTQPEERFASNRTKTRLPMRIAAHASFNYYANEELIVTPTFLFMRQGEAQEITGGVFLSKKVSETVALLGGLTYRYQDAFIPAIGMQMKSIKLGASYDVSTSDIGNSIYTSNAFELSFSYIFNRREVPNGVRCPVF